MRMLLASLLSAVGIGDCCGTSVPVCPERENGAEITFLIAGAEEITLWITNDAFIDEAINLMGTGETRVPNFLEVVPAPSCVDTDYTWHVDPQEVEWADVTIELCDGRPSYIEENLCSWIDEVGGWCPWSAEVVSVQDFRAE